MTMWDFFSEAAHWFDGPGFSDDIFRIILAALIILVIIEVSPLKAKPLSRMARALGKALNADVMDRLDKYDKRLCKGEKDNVRLQLLVLIHDYKENVPEILEVAHHYFMDIKGDWYMTTLFNNWLTDNHVGKPEWFDPDR